MFLAGVLVLAGLTATGTVSIHTGAIQAGTTRKAEQIRQIIEKQFHYGDDIKNEDLQNMSLKGYVAGLGDPVLCVLRSGGDERVFLLSTVREICRDWCFDVLRIRRQRRSQ